jgi:hypothetical protein
MRGRALAVVLALSGVGLTAGACTVGSGAGSAKGALFVESCDPDNSRPAPAAGQPLPSFDLHPSFFAGEPIDDVCPPPDQCPGEHTNRLVIRMQRSGNRIEVNDTLYFDIENAFQVAACIRGRTANGQPTWDTRMVTGPDGLPIPGLPWCDWVAHAPTDGGADAGTPDAGAGDGGAAAAMTATRARINLSTEDYLRASLAPLYTCFDARSVAEALPGSWIEFEYFGTAPQPTLDPASRMVVGGDFKVNFGDRLRATFHLELGDQRVINAIKSRDPVPVSRIGGSLDGFFDFNLDRGRAAQPFP